LSKTERTCYPYLQMSHSSELELPLQLQKWRPDILRPACGKKLITCERSAASQMEVISNHTRIRGKTWCVCLPDYISTYCVRSLYKFIYSLQVVKQLSKHTVFKYNTPIKDSASLMSTQFKLSQSAQIFPKI
jgi:hypothetical protein